MKLAVFFSSVALSGALVAAAGSLALADSEGGTEIHACVRKVTGMVRIVPAETPCLPREEPLTWNSEGPQGPPGLSSAPELLVAANLPDCPPAGETFVDCVTRVLPAGTWQVSYTAVNSGNLAKPTANTLCEMTRDGVALDAYPGTWGSGGMHIELSAAIQATSDTTITVRCLRNITLVEQELTALSVSPTAW